MLNCTNKCLKLPGVYPSHKRGDYRKKALTANLNQKVGEKKKKISNAT